MSEMTEQQNENHAVAILKPQYLLALAVIGLALTLASGFQPRFGFMGMVGLSILGLSIMTWGVIAPEQLRAAITGRTARYGGTSFVVTVVVIVALIALYILMRGISLTFDVTERDAFSVRPEIRESLVQIVGNTNTPDLQLVTFLSAEDAGLRDRLTLLYDDILSTTLGKVSYQFIDIDQQPILAEQYGVNGSQQIAVAPLDEEGNPIPSLSNLIEQIDMATFQNELIGFITTQNLQGNFGAYFVIEDGSVRLDMTDGTGMTFLSDDLRTVFGYDVLQGTMTQYRESGSDTLNSAEVDGETMILVGGNSVLTEENRLFLQGYLDKGGSLVLMPGLNVEGNSTLAADPELTTYLLENFGIAFNDDFVVDPVLNYQGSEIELLPNAISQENFIGQMGLTGDFSVQFMFGFPTNSIQLADDTLENVTAVSLITTSPNAYSIANAELPNFIQSASAPNPDQAVRSGALTIAASAENIETGSRLVLIGSATVAQDILTDLDVGQQLGIANRELVLRSVIWASNFNERVADLEQPVVVQRPSERVLIATEEQISTINGLLGLVLPFVVLGLGVFVVFLNREREQE
jgi:hypothetical protein